MSELKEYLAEQLKDPEFAEEYESMRPEYEAIRAMISARLECHSRIESGNRSPTIDTLDWAEDDAFCEQLYRQYEADPDKGQAVSLEEAARALGVEL